MKNIHLIATDKPSRLACDFDKLILNSRLLSPILYKTQNIYITSDEEIKEGGWCLDIKRNIIFQSKRSEIGTSKKIPIIICTYEGCYIQKDCKKIILTTDQDLIKDGVQSIDDAFLEWFVKNPSCKEVQVEVIDDNIQWYKIIIPRKNFYCGDEVDYDDKCLEQCDGCVDATGVDYGYLPKEKPKYPIGGYAPGNYMCNCSTCKTQFQGDKRAVQCEPCAVKMIQKQHLIDMMKGDEELGLYDEIHPEQIWNEEKKKGIKQLIQDHKKETLEEFAERLFPNKMEEYDIFLMGARWQQERSYSEEDMRKAIQETITLMRYKATEFREHENTIIEKFKKK